MVNRTFKPIPFAEYDSLTGEKAESKSLRVAYLGDESGYIRASSNGDSIDHYGKAYIRFQSGTDSNGATVYGQAIEAWVNPNANYTYKPGLPVLVYFDRPTQAWVVDRVDVVRAAKAGYNTHALNPISPSGSKIWLRQISDLNVFAPATALNNATTVSVEPSTFIFDGEIYDGTQTGIDLSIYIPSAGTERLVLIGERANNRTIQLVVGNTRTITSTKYALSDIAALIDAFDDYVIPLRAVKLSDNANTVREKDLHQDLRQFINVQQPRGFPSVIKRQIKLLSDYQQLYKGALAITTGELVIQGELLIA